MRLSRVIFTRIVFGVFGSGASSDYLAFCCDERIDWAIVRCLLISRSRDSVREWRKQSGSGFPIRRRKSTAEVLAQLQDKSPGDRDTSQDCSQLGS